MMSARSPFAALLAAVLWLPTTILAQAPATAPPAAPVDAIDAVVAQIMQAQTVPGVSIAVVKDGRVLIAKGYGFSNVEKATKATEQTIYQLASVTKPFTAMATLMLVDDGKLSLDRKISEILPGLPAAWAPVTVKHLLSHTSGIKSYTDVFGEQKTPDGTVFTRDEILALVKDAPLAFPPGDRFAYCNTGYFVLGMIIEKVSGKPYGTFLQERIFTPLAMTSTTIDDYADARPQRAQGYGVADGKAVAAAHTHPSQPFAAGALVSTVVDLAKWDAALTSRKLLTPASYELLWTPMRLNNGAASTYALGWQVDPFRTRPRQAHGGGITGFSTFVSRFPDDKISVLVLTNQGGAAGGLIANSLAAILIPALEANAPKPIADTDPKLTAFLRQVLIAAAAGTSDPAWLTPEFAGVLLPDRIKQGSQALGRLGTLQSFDLMEEATRDTRRIRAYRAVFGATPVRVTYVLTVDGKIAGLNIQAQN